jgi:hypothetical protein
MTAKIHPASAFDSDTQQQIECFLHGGRFEKLQQPLPHVVRRTGLVLAPASYQTRVPFTIFTTDSITGTSISTPTTVASAAPELKPKRLIAAATGNDGTTRDLRHNHRHNPQRL